MQLVDCVVPHHHITTPPPAPPTQLKCHLTELNSAPPCIFHLISVVFAGAPQVLRLHPSPQTVTVKRGEAAVLNMVVCADPRPLRVAWEWGSLRLEAGSGIGAYTYLI